jgi:pimeloyl-ACP methyl ester carboxylesterase
VFDARRIGQLTLPTLLLMGSESPAFLKAPTTALVRALPNCRVVVMQGQAHIAMNTAPELFAREVLSFLTGDTP